MDLSIYVDGSGGDKAGYGYFVKETGDSFHESKPGITNNQAEYMAIISALEKFGPGGHTITIYSDSKNTVSQLNHEFAINSEPLRELARKAWTMMAKIPNLKIVWVPRAQNLAGKMLGS